MSGHRSSVADVRRAAWHVALPVVFYALLALFLLRFLRGIDMAQLRAAHVSLLHLVIASALALTARLWGAGVWFVMLKGMGADVSRAKRELLHVYAKAWLGRYIPGTVPWILGKIYFASRHGIDKRKLAASSLLEGGLQVVVTMIVASLALLFDRRLAVITTPVRLIMMAVIVVGVISLVPAIFNKLFSLATRLLRAKTLDRADLATQKIVLHGALLYTAYALITGVSFFFVAKAVHPALSYQDLSFVVGVNSLAASVSMLAIFAPGGLGVREGIQLVLLSLILPKEAAVVVTVLARLWSVAIDVAFYGIGVCMTLNRREDS